MPVLTSPTLPAGASVVKGASCDIVIDSSGNIIGWLPVAFQNIAGGTEYQPIPCIATDPLTGGGRKFFGWWPEHPVWGVN